MRFRKRPVVIEAVQFTGHNGTEIEQWSGGKAVASPVLEPTQANPTGAYLQIATLEGPMIAIVSDWIIRGVKGEFCSCRADIFEMTYESAEGTLVIGEGVREGVREQVLLDFEAACKRAGYQRLPDIIEAVQSYLSLCRTKEGA